MQLRLFRHFVPVSVVLLASSDALLITGAFYQLLSASEIGAPIVLRISSFTVQFSAGLAVAAVTAMVSVGLYGHQSFVDFRPLFLCHLLARGTRLPARCQKLPAEGDAYMAGLCVSDAGYVFSDFGTRITQ